MVPSILLYLATEGRLAARAAWGRAYVSSSEGTVFDSLSEVIGG
jgi:hypothetical protein